MVLSSAIMADTLLPFVFFWKILFLQFSSITFTFAELQSFELAMQDFHPHSHSSLVLKPGIICTFLIHSGSLQKILTALFNLAQNTQKSKWTIFLSAKAKCFLVLKRFTCCYIVLNLNISFKVCARPRFNVIWFIK